VLYKEAINSEFDGTVRIGIVTHLYRDLFHINKGFGDSGSCNVDVVCEEGNGWEDEVRAIGMIINENGSRACTGTLINNTALDGVQYFLTAEHCLPSDIADLGVWSFIFDYKSDDCDPSVDGLLGNSVFGSELIASNNTHDFALLEIDELIPSGYDVYFAGWSRSTLLISNTTCLHHPSGDVMKISKDDNPPVLSGFPLPTGDDYWKVVDWDLGTTEGGSSGSPLFNPSGKLIGQERGGSAACGNDASDFYGALYKSWDFGTSPSGRLKDWLDPLGDDPTSLSGINLNDVGVTEIVNEVNFSIYPNPSEDNINIRFESDIYIDYILINDISGRSLLSIDQNSTISGVLHIDINGLAKGIYQLIIYSSNSTLTKNFVIK